MFSANIFRLFGIQAEEAENSEESAAEELEWREMPFVSRFADGSLFNWSPPTVDVQDTDTRTDHRIGITQTAIGESYGLQLIAHMRRHGYAAQKRLGQVVAAMHERKHWSNIEKGFWGVIGGYIANPHAAAPADAAARMSAAR